MTSFPVLNHFNGSFVNLYAVSEQAGFLPLRKKIVIEVEAEMLGVIAPHFVLYGKA